MYSENMNEKILQNIEEVNGLIDYFDSESEENTEEKMYLKGQLKALEFCSRLALGINESLNPLDLFNNLQINNI